MRYRRASWLVLLVAACGDDGGSGGGGDADAYAAAVRAADPVAYWRFDEVDGTEAANAVSGAPAGAYFGGFTLGAEGVVAGNTAVALDGTTGCIGVGDHFRFAGRVEFSVEAWVKLTKHGENGTRLVSTEGFPTGIRSGWNLSANYPGSGYPYFDAWNSDADDNLYTMGAYASVSPDHGVLPLNTWSHVVGTYSDTSEKLWVNGILRDSQNQSTHPIPAMQGALSLGCASDGSGRIYLGVTGTLDEVAIYDHVLDEATVAEHYATAMQ